MLLFFRMPSFSRAYSSSATFIAPLVLHISRRFFPTFMVCKPWTSPSSPMRSASDTSLSLGLQIWPQRSSMQRLRSTMSRHLIIEALSCRISRLPPGFLETPSSSPHNPPTPVDLQIADTSQNVTRVGRKNLGISCQMHRTLHLFDPPPSNPKRIRMTLRLSTARASCPRGPRPRLTSLKKPLLMRDHPISNVSQTNGMPA